MDVSTVSGANMTAVGMITVFLALTLLMLIVMLIARLLATHPSPSGPASSPEPDGTTAADGSPATEESRLRGVAIAAYALHEARRVTVRGPEPSTSWVRAGRQWQVGRMGSRC